MLEKVKSREEIEFIRYKITCKNKRNKSEIYRTIILTIIVELPKIIKAYNLGRDTYSLWYFRSRDEDMTNKIVKYMKILLFEKGVPIIDIKINNYGDNTYGEIYFK